MIQLDEEKTSPVNGINELCSFFEGENLFCSNEELLHHINKEHV